MHSVKWRPTVLLIAAGLIAALILAIVMDYTEAIAGIVGVLGGTIYKLLETEEKT